MPLYVSCPLQSTPTLNKKKPPKKQNKQPTKNALIIQFAPEICPHKCIHLVNTIFPLGGKYKTDFVHLHISASHNI